MNTKIDMSGWIMKEHGVPESKLIVIKEDKKIGKHLYWICKCECGREKIIRGDQIRSGISKSCGECSHI